MTNVWLEFNGTAMFVNGSKRTRFPAVSGRPSHLSADSDPNLAAFSYSDQKQKEQSGPIPSGRYKIRLSDARVYEHTKTDYAKSLGAIVIGMSPTAYLCGMDRAWGKVGSMGGRIVPILNNDGTSDYAFGRNRCWIHGSANGPGSIGCIDLIDRMDDFLATLEGYVGATSVAAIPLFVNYGIFENPDMPIGNRNNVA